MSPPADLFESLFAIRIGEMRFGPIDTCILILAVAAALLSALNLWRTGQSEDRQRLLLDALRRASRQGSKPLPQAPRPP
jgi:hypothetical protein